MLEKNCLRNDQKYNIDIFENGNFKRLFYVPNSIEICRIESKVPPELKNETLFPVGLAEKIDENDLELSIREHMIPLPTLTRQHKEFKNLNESIKEGIVISNFKEAYSYGGKTFNLLVYMTLMRNIFDLEYTICKLNSSGKDILNLETQVLSGQKFWKDESEVYEAQYDQVEASDQEDEAPATGKNVNFGTTGSQNYNISAVLIKRIVKERREKQHLAEDLKHMNENFKHMMRFVKSEEDRTIENVTSVFMSHHQLFYYLVLHGMEKVQDSNKDRIQEVDINIRHFTNKNEGIITNDNGFYVSHALIEPNG